MNLYKLIYFILAVIFAKCKNTMRVASAQPTSLVFSKNLAPAVPCGGLLTDKHGVIATPNFPQPFSVPISCAWIIDASAFWGSPNASIFVYLTQQFVLSGLSFKEYMYYSDDFKVPSEMETIVKEENVTRTVSVQSNSPFLEIKFQLDNLYGTHLRVMDHLLDVYGFNITYEVDTPKPYQCNTRRCSFLGDCLAAKNFSSYYCQCFDGYSGLDCSIGPLCSKKYCENGGVCKHIGDSNVECVCPYGYSGNKCETHEFLDEEHECKLSKDSQQDEDDVDEFQCESKCRNDLRNFELCRCHQNHELAQGRVRFETSLRLGNASIFNINEHGTKKVNIHYAALLEKYISRFLRNFNISKINDLEIFSKTPSENDLMFHFFGVENDSLKVREAINKMVEKGRIGNFSLVSTHYSLHQEPGLVLQSLKAQQKSPLREKDDLVLTCTAQGSSETTFSWYKNGFILNVSRSIRKISVHQSSMDADGKTQSVLRVNSTEKLDGGFYTCQVSDWGLQLCRTIKVEVLEPPEVRLEPPSVTLFRGDSMRIRCLASQKNRIQEKLGYSWTKNHALFHSDPEFEMWEDLHPDGSILTIHNVHKSAVYSCAISNSLAIVSTSIHVNVMLDIKSMSICPENLSFGIKWPSTTSGPPVLNDCPISYSGKAQRYCEQQDYNKSIWLTPDFSDCINQKLLRISYEFKELTYGFQKTNASTLLRSCLEYVMNHHNYFLPGEGGYLLDLLQDVYEYSQRMDDSEEKEISCDVTLKIIDVILLNETSLNKPTQVKKLQDLVQLVTINRESTTFVMPASSPTSSKSISSSASISPMRQLKSLQIFKSNVKTLPFSYQIYGDQLFSNQMYLEIGAGIALTNGSLTISVVSYRNLTYFLPKMYFSRNSFGTDINYIPASKIISSWLFYANQEKESGKTTYFNLPLNAAHVEIIFQHENSPSNEWIPLCGFDSKASYDPSWRTDICITENLMENITRCICPISGTFVVLLVKKSFNITPIKPTSIPMVVVICCGCCFLQSTIAFVVLLPNIYVRRCYISINFALMQFCLSVSATMSFIVLSLLKFLPQEWYALLSSGFAAILLLSSSTLVAIVLIIQSELEIETSALYASTTKLQGDTRKASLKKLSIKTSTTTTTTPSTDSSQTVTDASDHTHQSPSNSIRKQQKTAALKFANLSSTNRGVKSAICLSWLLPILCAMCIPMVHQIIGHRSGELWLETTSPDFIIFAITESLLVFLFVLLFVTLMNHLIYLSRKYEKVNTMLKKRIGLLNRIALLYVINFLSHIFYLMYLNTNGSVFCYLFSSTSILLGLLIILCFALKVENYAVAETTSSSTKSSMKNSLDDFCTTTINNSLNFYASQDMEKDNKSLPMRVFSNTISSYPLDTTKCSKATTSLMQQQQSSATTHRHPLHSRLTDVQICSNEIIDLTSASQKEMTMAVGNLNAQSRSYELTQKMNSNMMSVYDAKSQHLDILQGISKDSIVGIRDNNLELKKTPTITLTNSDGKRACVTEGAAADPMLNLISNDLDYLLNRTQEVPQHSADAHQHLHQQLPAITPPPPAAFSNPAKSPALLLQHDVIIEESEHEVDS